MTYLGEGGQIPFLSKATITSHAVELLDECWDGMFPVDIEAICDFLGVALLPVVGLSDSFHIDAFIAADFKRIFVDEQAYRQESHRYRFSVAHELGHLILHREYYSSRINSLEEWLGLSRNMDHDYVEFQANYFAGSLLTPGNYLTLFLNQEFNGSFSRNCWSTSRGELKFILSRAKQFFRVSDQVIARRMRDTFPGAEGLDIVTNRLHIR